MTPLHTSALVVVDMLNDFIARGGYYDEIAKLRDARPGALTQPDIDALTHLHRHPPRACVIRDGYQDLTSRVASIAEGALASQMWTVFVRTTYDPTSTFKPPLFIATPDRKDYACHAGSWGAELADPIKTLASHPRAKLIDKPTYDAFLATDLLSFLRLHRIDTLYLAGVETNICVLFTALTALSNGFATVILEDCVATSLQGLHEPALQIVEAAKGRRMSRQEFLTHISPMSARP
jgi:nicotinamidase-related amidase